MPVSRRSDVSLTSCRSIPSSRIRPEVGALNRGTRSTSVLFPAPLAPTSARISPLRRLERDVGEHRLVAVRERHAFESHSLGHAGHLDASRGRRCASVVSSSTSNRRSALAIDDCAVAGTCESCLSGCSMRNTMTRNVIRSAAVQCAVHEHLLRTDPEHQHGDRGTRHLGEWLRQRAKRRDARHRFRITSAGVGEST